MKELVSVIIPFLNEEEFIKDTIESILAQTYKNIELILVDDYSTDRSLEICHSFDDSRIVIHSKTTEPKGNANTRNLGIDLAKGSIIAFQDADDISLPTRIEKQVALINKHGPNTIAGVRVEKIINGSSHEMNLPVDHEEIIKGFKKVIGRSVSIVAGVICARVEIYRKFRYNPNLKYQQDWDFLLRLYESGEYKFYNVPEYLYRYLINTTGTKYKKDWVDWNLVVRANQARRKNNQPEFRNPDELSDYLKKHPGKRAKTSVMKWMIRLKKRISSEFRQISSQ